VLYSLSTAHLVTKATKAKALTEPAEMILAECEDNGQAADARLTDTRLALNNAKGT
jgi:hypothetical protein